MANEKNRAGESRRMRASERRATAAKSSNPFNTVSASSRRARQGRPTTSLTSEKRENQIDQSMLADILSHPTKEVSEAELRQEYSYVLADIRSMGILAASLIVLLIVLAQVLLK